MVSAVDLLKGIGRLAGMEVCEVPGATGYIDTNYEGKRRAALDALAVGRDFAYIHVEAPDECGHRGEPENKVKAIEDIDRLILAPLAGGAGTQGRALRPAGFAGSPHPAGDPYARRRAGALSALPQRQAGYRRAGAVHRGGG